MEKKGYTSDSYWAYLDENVLAGTRCENCAEVYLPPRPLCRSCGQSEMEWVEFKGTGYVETFSMIYFPTAEIMEAGFGRDNPSCTAVVRLEEGPAISAQIVAPDFSATPEVGIGDRVEAAFVKRVSGKAERNVLVFVKSG